MKTNTRRSAFTLLPFSFLLTCTFLLLPFNLLAQSAQYQQTMLHTLEEMEHASGYEATLACASQFERIASAEKTLWLPYYYSAYSLIAMSFSETDGPKKDQILERAQQNLDKAFELNPDESELHALQAFLYPSWVSVDPMGRGILYIEKMGEALKKAKASNPENPRALFLEAIHIQNLPPSMGGGQEMALPIFKEAEKQFSSFENDDPLWPAWGEEANRGAMQSLH